MCPKPSVSQPLGLQFIKSVYFCARWQSSASGSSSHSRAVRNFADLRSELTLHALAAEPSRKPDVGSFWKYLCLWESGTSSGTG